MSDRPSPNPFSSGRGTLASLGARRRGWPFTRNGARDEPEQLEDAPQEEGPLRPGMLDALASRGSREIPEEPERRSVLSLSGASPAPAPEVAGETESLTPLIAHSTLGELAGLEEHPTSAFPVERAILISLAAHLILIILLMVVPTRVPVGSKGDLFAGLIPEPKDETPIPIIFADAPGPARPNPKRSPLSDADRRASGGDPSRPKAAVPFVPPSTGVTGLAPGRKAPRVAGSEVPVAPGATSEAERRAAAAQAPSEQKPSEFPSSQKPLTTGEGETTKLAGLDSAIREAARGTVGGEGGAPTGNADGGFVDNGPLSFDTTWYDWGPYAAEMIRRIKLHWDVPELARLGWKGSLTVRFFILADGRVADAKILRGSSIPPFDFAAFQAIVKSSPFGPSPADLGSTREGVTVTFFYNMRPEEEGTAR